MTVAGVGFALFLPALMAGSAGIRTHLEQGQLAWRQSCSQVPPGDECVRVTEARQTIAMIKGPLHRGLGCVHMREPRRVAVFPRNPRLVRRAQHHFHLVARDAGADLEARAHALFYLAEKEREDFLRVAVHDVSSGGRKLQMLEQAKRAYLETAAVGEPLWVLAAHARIGSLYRDFDTQVRADEFADWLREQAIPWFQRCLRQAHDLSEYGQWSDGCWLALNEYLPYEYPRAYEIGLALEHAPPMAVVPAFLRSRLDAL